MTGNLWRMMMCIGRSKAPTRLQCRIATVGKASNQTSLPIISNHPWTQCSCQWQKLRWNHQDWHICTWITWTSQSPLFLGLLFTSIDNYFHFWSIYNQVMSWMSFFKICNFISLYILSNELVYSGICFQNHFQYRAPDRQDLPLSVSHHRRLTSHLRFPSSFLPIAEIVGPSPSPT